MKPSYCAIHGLTIKGLSRSCPLCEIQEAVRRHTAVLQRIVGEVETLKRGTFAKVMRELSEARRKAR